MHTGTRARPMANMATSQPEYEYVRDTYITYADTPKIDEHE